RRKRHALLVNRTTSIKPLIRSTVPARMRKDACSGNGRVPKGVRSIATATLAVNAARFSFHPDLYAIKNPASIMTTETPRAKHDQLNDCLKRQDARAVKGRDRRQRVRAVANVAARRTRGLTPGGIVFCAR